MLLMSRICQENIGRGAYFSELLLIFVELKSNGDAAEKSEIKH